MSTLITLLALVTPIAMVAGWLAWRTKSSLVYEGAATVMDQQNHYGGRQTFLVLQINDRPKRQVYAHIPLRRDYGLLGKTVQIRETKRRYARAEVEQVEYNGVVDRCKREDGLLVCTLNLVVACLTVVAASELGLGTAAWLTVAFAVSMAGFSINLFRFDEVKPDGNTLTFLKFMRMPKGLIGWVIPIVLLTILTVWCFSVPGFWMLFPGANLAFELGGMIAFLFRWAWRQD